MRKTRIRAPHQTNIIPLAPLQLSRGQRASGDLIPWTVAQQFGDSAFAGLSGARIVRVAVNPTVQGMGYGSRAVELLYRFYNGDMIDLGMGEKNGDGENSSDEEGEGNDSDSDSDSDSLSSAKSTKSSDSGGDRR